MTRKDLLLRAIKAANDTIATCEAKPGDPEPKTENDRKIVIAMAECTALAKGRRQAFEAVLDAMNGSSKMLEYYATR